MNRDQVIDAITYVNTNFKAIDLLLRETIKEISDKFDIGLTFKKFKYERNWMLETDYYKRFLLLFEFLQDREEFLELGTQTGATCAVASQFFNHVVSYDLDVSEVSDKITNHKNIDIHKLLHPTQFMDLSFEFKSVIFVDIDHIGEKEYNLHLKLKSKKFEGMVLWDDVDINPQMKEFWAKIPDFEKITVNEWHPECGFGITFYG